MAELEKFIETDADDGTVKLNGKNTFKKNQYVTEGNYAVDLANSDIWEANGIWFADTPNASNEGLMFPRSDGKWDSLGVLDGKIKLTAGITTGLGVPIAGGNTQVIADYVVEEGISGNWTWKKWASGEMEVWGKQTPPVTGTTNSFSIAMPVTFVNTEYMVDMTPGHNGSIVTKYGDYNANGMDMGTLYSHLVCRQSTTSLGTLLSKVDGNRKELRNEY